MNRLAAFLRDERGTAGEFALILPLAMLFMFGIIDAGRWLWEINQAEKATQMGARFAVVTAPVASGLSTYSFAVNGGITQGTVVPITAFQQITCQSNNGTVSCACPNGAPCAFGTAANSAAFTNIVTRMQSIMPEITADNVVIDYSWSGLGFSGDPNGPDVAPLTTVSLRNMSFSPTVLIAFDGSIGLPRVDYSLTMEDGQGSESF